MLTDAMVEAALDWWAISEGVHPSMRGWRASHKPTVQGILAAALAAAPADFVSGDAVQALIKWSGGVMSEREAMIIVAVVDGASVAPAEGAVMRKTWSEKDKIRA